MTNDRNVSKKLVTTKTQRTKLTMSEEINFAKDAQTTVDNVDLSKITEIANDLEKKKDYVVRAKDYHRKRDHIARLEEKARLRNPDEFYFGMISISKILLGKKPYT